jgi:hypothetical protein
MSSNDQIANMLIQQRQLLNNINDQLTAVSLNLPASADLWALKRQYQKLDEQLVENISSFRHNQVDTLRPYPKGTPKITFRESMRVVRKDSMRVIQEHRYKVLTLVLSIILLLLTTFGATPSWIGTLFSSH